MQRRYLFPNSDAIAILTSCQLSQPLTGQRQNLPREF